MTTGLLVWSPVLRLIKLAASPRRMLEMRSHSHSSLTTEDHRWPIERKRGNPRNRRWERGFTTSGEGFRTDDRVVTAAPYGEFPVEAKWSDAFVELVAWFWTEGNIRSSTGVAISQSTRANPRNCDRIRSALWELFGPPSQGRLRWAADGRPEWREKQERSDLAVWYLNKHAGAELLAAAPGRVVTAQFLLVLTRAQLELFITTSIDADGTTSSRGHRTLAQKYAKAADAFQMACTLAGIGTTQRGRDGVRLVNLLTRTRIQPGRFTSHARWVDHEGPVWCIETGTGTWVARHDGTVFVTGNCGPRGIPRSVFLTWADDDIEAALFWQAEQDAKCVGCGRLRVESFDPDGPGYDAIPLRCRACEAQTAAARAFHENGDPAGVYFALEEHRRVDLER